MCILNIMQKVTAMHNYNYESRKDNRYVHVLAYELSGGIDDIVRTISSMVEAIYKPPPAS